MTYKELSLKYTKATEIAAVQEQYIAKLEELIRDKDTSNDRLTLDQITEAVCNYYKVSESDVFGNRRFRNIVVPRQVICYIARFNISGLSLKDIGLYLGKRDHTTVISSIKRVEDEISYNYKFKDEINEIKGMLNL
tara:strand:+ start:567 stop:974 length:408 start_codon:yes stop_codon:yes gene_type:complete